MVSSKSLLFCTFLLIGLLTANAATTKNQNKKTANVNADTDSASDSILCDGSAECANEDLDYEYVYCLGYESCEDDNITSTYSYDYGYLSTTASRINSTYAYEFGYQSADSSQIRASNVYAYGYQSALEAVIYAERVYAYGYFAASYAEIAPLDADLVVYFYGLYAGANADVICEAGQTCRIYCGDSYGCYETSFYCYSDATCFYSCDTDGYCPSLYGGLGEATMTDVEILKKLTLNQAIKKEKLEAGFTLKLEIPDLTLTKDELVQEERDEQLEVFNSMKIAKLEHKRKNNTPQMWQFGSVMAGVVIGLMAGMLVMYYIGGKQWGKNYVGYERVQEMQVFAER